jgi:RluA family pseudouridine synthase
MHVKNLKPSAGGLARLPLIPYWEYYSGMIEWTVTEPDSGSALFFLEQKIPAAPRSYLRQLLRKGNVSGNFAQLAEDSNVQPGDLVTLAESSRLLALLAAVPQLDILYETRELLIVNKPVGLAIHRSKGHEEDNLHARVESLMKTRKSTFSVAPVHRLDLETSGPVIFAKGRQAASQLGQLFIAGQAGKHYLALVTGEVTGCGLLSTPVSAKGKLKEAATGFRCLASDLGLSLLELELHTGRTHQIRQQLAATGHPITGDQRYRGAMLAGLPRMFLHCWRLTLPDPFGGPTIAIDCPLPEDLAEFLRRQHPVLLDTLEKSTFDERLRHSEPN